MTPLNADIVIFGGGITGLWTLASLRKAGYQAILLESRALGGVQSIASQGIIHGGTKYALNGKLSASSQAISGMPALWQDCLAGNGELDLSPVRIMSTHQYLWSTGSLASNLSGFFAGKLMRSRVAALETGAYPPPFDHRAFQGKLYQLNEPVLDTASLVKELLRQVGAYCWQVLPEQLQPDTDTPNGFGIRTAHGVLRIASQYLLFAAGSGNRELLSLWGRQEPVMQERPLHMLMLKGDLPAVFAHCLGPSTSPLVTITSYPQVDGRVVWYLGGQIAETGVERDTEAQIAAGKAELVRLLPWLDTSAAKWASLRVNRAEPLMKGGQRPDDCFLHIDHGVMTAWPTKLAFAPRLAGKVLQALTPVRQEQSAHDWDSPPGLARPAVARYPWEEVDRWY